MQWFSWARCGNNVKGPGTVAVEPSVPSFLLLIPSLWPSEHLRLCSPPSNQITKITTMVSLLHGRHYTKHLVNIVFFNPHKKILVREIFSFPFHRGVNWGAERLNRHTAAKWRSQGLFDSCLVRFLRLSVPVMCCFPLWVLTSRLLTLHLWVSKNTKVWEDLNKKLLPSLGRNLNH